MHVCLKKKTSHCWTKQKWWIECVLISLSLSACVNDSHELALQTTFCLFFLKMQNRIYYNKFRDKSLFALTLDSRSSSFFLISFSLYLISCLKRHSSSVAHCFVYLCLFNLLSFQQIQSILNFSRSIFNASFILKHQIISY